MQTEMRGLTVLEIKNLKVSTEGKEILKGIDLEVGTGQLHVLMGPNGSGKSTLAQVIMGSPSYKVESGELRMENKDLKKLSPDKRAKLGIFMAFQHPVEVPGVSVFNVLRKAKQAAGPVRSFLPAFAKASAGKPASDDSAAVSLEAKRSGIENPSTSATRFNPAEFRKELLIYLSSLKLSDDFLSRALNEGFSGGEKKRSEILQMMALSPKLVILDEIDSGLDVDGLKIVAGAIKQFIRRRQGYGGQAVGSPQSAIILITHYARILKYLKPDFVHIMMEGQIIKSGKASLAQRVEEKGYQAWQTL